MGKTNRVEESLTSVWLWMCCTVHAALFPLHTHALVTGSRLVFHLQTTEMGRDAWPSDGITGRQHISTGFILPVQRKALTSAQVTQHKCSEQVRGMEDLDSSDKGSWSLVCLHVYMYFGFVGISVCRCTPVCMYICMFAYTCKRG